MLVTHFILSPLPPPTCPTSFSNQTRDCQSYGMWSLEINQVKRERKKQQQVIHCIMSLLNAGLVVFSVQRNRPIGHHVQQGFHRDAGERCVCHTRHGAAARPVDAHDSRTGQCQL